MRAQPRSSGDLLADRRYEYARALAEAGDFPAAADLIDQALEIVPGWVEGWMGLAEAREAAGDRNGAAAALRQVLGLDPEDRSGAGLHLARLDGETPPASPAAYVRELFDAYSEDFEAALTGKLEYRAPGLLAAALDAVAPDRTFALGLDLGCGTGLMGERLAGRVARLEGVDLAPAMVARAEAKGVYAALRVGDVVADLAASSEPLDLVIAADVFCYLGDLAPVLAAARTRVPPGGLIAFSVEAGSEPGYRLRDSLRYAHHPDYVRQVLTQAGWSIRVLETATLRRDRGVAISGLVVVAD